MPPPTRRYRIRTFYVELPLRQPPPTRVRGPEDALVLLRPIYAALDADQEHITALFLDTAHQVIAYKLIASGGADHCAVDPRILFRRAMEAKAAALIVAHNHPSTESTPSAEDRHITGKLRMGAEVLGLKLLDHIVLAADGGYATIPSRAKEAV